MGEERKKRSGVVAMDVYGWFQDAMASCHVESHVARSRDSIFFS